MKPRRWMTWVAVPAMVAGGALAGCSQKNQGSDMNRTDTTAAGMAAPTGSTSASAADRMGLRPGGALNGSFTGTDSLWNYDQPLGESAATFGGEGEPHWSATTVAAANRGTTGHAVTVKGEVVDASCYLELGKRGSGHIPCATDCVKNGQPVGLVDADNNLYLLFPEEHDPRRYGNTDLAQAMIPYLGKTVTVNGMLVDRAGAKAIFVLGYTVGAQPNQQKGGR